MKRLTMLIALLLFFSCNDSVEPEQKQPHQDLLNFLTSQGFDTKGALIENDQIIIEKDMAFDIDDLRLRMAESGTSRDKQWRTQYLISQSRARDVKVKLDRRLSSAWKSSARSAMAQLNNVANSKIYLREVSSGYDIIVKYGNTPSARGTFPSSSGRAGHTIIINRRLRPTGYYRNTMLHEFGHNIGLRHDHAPREGISSWQQISGTPYSDTYSVMSYNRSRYFTYYDKLAISTLYPR